LEFMLGCPFGPHLLLEASYRGGIGRIEPGARLEDDDAAANFVGHHGAREACAAVVEQPHGVAGLDAARGCVGFC
jgi:hypothetical protein